jgi:hypothetical protein
MTTRVLSLMSNSMCIAIILIMICHHILSWAPTRETRCIILSFIFHAKGRKLSLGQTMWHHYEVQIHSTSSIGANSWWKNLIYQICGDLDNDFFNIGIKGQFENWNQVQSLFNGHDKFKNLKWVLISWWIFFMYPIVMFDYKFFRPNMTFCL